MLIFYKDCKPAGRWISGFFTAGKIGVLIKRCLFLGVKISHGATVKYTSAQNLIEITHFLGLVTIKNTNSGTNFGSNLWW